MNVKRQMKLNEKQQEMVVKNQRLVYYIVNKMGILQHEYEDVLSIGTLGLIKAVSTFDETKGITFATYATRCINNEIFMYYRREKKHLVVTSLEAPINTDFDGNELSLADIITDSEQTFLEQIEAYDTFSKVMDFILNVLGPNERKVTLYSMAGFKQDEIAEKLNFSQSYISRLEKRAHTRVKKFLSDTEQFKEVFNVAMEENLYKISFSSTDVKNFNSIFSSLIRFWNPNERLPSFKITCTSERIFIILPAIEESFAFIADIIAEIDNYAMKTVSENGSGVVFDEAESEFTKTGKKSKNTAVSNSDSIPEKTGEESTKTRKKTKITEVDNSGSITREPESSSVRKDSKMEMIRSYILGVEEFTVKELKEKFTFPNSNFAINNAITDCKNKDLIVRIAKGKYSVKR